MLAEIAHRLHAKICGPSVELHVFDEHIEVAPIRIRDVSLLLVSLAALPVFQFSSREQGVCIGFGQARTLDDIPTTIPEGMFVWRACEFPSLQPPQTTAGIHWHEFTRNKYVLPEIGIVSSGASAFIFACSSASVDRLVPTDSLVYESEQLVNTLHLPGDPMFSPSYSRWSEAIQRVSDSMDEVNTKVVFARKATYDQAPSITAVVHHLLSKKTRYSGMIQSGDSAFAFASPERLFLRQDQELHTEAVAGTRRKGQTAEEEQLLRNSLLTSTKDLHEHAIVAEDICEQLQSITSSVEKDGPDILDSSSVQHLYTRIHAQLLPDVADSAIVEALHPTPAVLGKQREWALRNIESLESWPRGLYAGTIGVHVGSTAEYCVAIRSLLLQNSYLHVFTGAGIVADSDPDAEWEEIQQKLESVIGI